ncbi:hypothetical protein CXB34_20765 [Pseudomonas amygdali pv. morsprunorum]|nr:hypothetical protein CXB34_20765 [Pseudomonas amygdali pv. morsprunorum]
MTTKADQWTQAFALLQRFERQIVMPNLFSWKYITDQCGISKATLWRNKQFEAEYQRIKAIVNSYTLVYCLKNKCSVKSSMLAC